MSQGFFQPYLAWFHDFLQCFGIYDMVAPRNEIQQAPSVKTHLALSPLETQGDNSSRCTRSSLRYMSGLGPAECALAAHLHGRPEVRAPAPPVASQHRAGLGAR